MKVRDLIKEIETLKRLHEQINGDTDSFLDREININGIIFDSNLGHGGMYIIY